MTTAPCLWARLAVVATLLLVPCLQAEESSPDKPATAHLFAYWPKAGLESEFDDGYRSHLEWHRRHQDPLVWYGWYVTHGERAGMFIDGTFGRPFAALDERVRPGEDGADFARTTAPFADVAFRRAYVLRRDLSTGQPLEQWQPSAFVHVVRYHVRAGMELKFERVVEVARSALPGVDQTPTHTWYELALGGQHAEYMLMIPVERFADFDRPRNSLSDLVTQANGEAGAADLLKNLSAAVKSVESELWRYREDLSYFPQQ